jgi:hypothetical protein
MRTLSLILAIALGLLAGCNITPRTAGIGVAGLAILGADTEAEQALVADVRDDARTFLGSGNTITEAVLREYVGAKLLEWRLHGYDDAQIRHITGKLLIAKYMLGKQWEIPAEKEQALREFIEGFVYEVGLFYGE